MTQIKAGDLVRVKGRAFTNAFHPSVVRHHIKPGAVCEVLYVRPDGKLEINGPIRWDARPGYEGYNAAVGCCMQQVVEAHQVKPAKQAMRKRDAYANRRG